MNLYTNGLESAIKSAKTIVLFLTQRYPNRGISHNFVDASPPGQARQKLRNPAMKQNTAPYSTTLSPTFLSYCFDRNGLLLGCCCELYAKSWWVTFVPSRTCIDASKGWVTR